jgi:hypothetical protein
MEQDPAEWAFEGSGGLPDICSRIVGLDESTRVEPDKKNTGNYAGLLEKSRLLRGALHEKDLL